MLAAYCDSLKPGAKLKFHAGWSGWTRPPTMGGGSPRAKLSAKGGGGLEGSERLDWTASAN